MTAKLYGCAVRREPAPCTLCSFLSTFTLEVNRFRCAGASCRPITAAPDKYRHTISKQRESGIQVTRTRKRPPQMSCAQLSRQVEVAVQSCPQGKQAHLITDPRFHMHMIVWQTVSNAAVLSVAMMPPHHNTTGARLRQSRLLTLRPILHAYGVRQLLQVVPMGRHLAAYVHALTTTTAHAVRTAVAAPDPERHRQGTAATRHGQSLCTMTCRQKTHIALCKACPLVTFDGEALRTCGRPVGLHHGIVVETSPT